MVFAAVLAWPQFVAAATHDEQLLALDAREYARRWIDKNLLPGTWIALELYSPCVDRQKLVVNGYDWMLDLTPDWYVGQGFEYLGRASSCPRIALPLASRMRRTSSNLPATMGRRGARANLRPSNYPGGRYAQHQSRSNWRCDCWESMIVKLRE
jgi:hypothetical protein